MNSASVQSSYHVIKSLVKLLGNTMSGQCCYCTLNPVYKAMCSHNRLQTDMWWVSPQGIAMALQSWASCHAASHGSQMKPEHSTPTPSSLRLFKAQIQGSFQHWSSLLHIQGTREESEVYTAKMWGSSLSTGVVCSIFKGPGKRVRYSQLPYLCNRALMHL